MAAGGASEELCIDPVVAGQPLQRVGSFRCYSAGERWEWSDTVARMHGYEPGSVTPTTELLLAHKHPEDRDQVSELLGEVLGEGKPFSSRHRIIDTNGDTRWVVVVGDRLLDDDGATIGTTGFYIDVTAARDADVQDAVSEYVAETAETRATIEQAKGMLMLAYGINAEHAFDVLRWRSQEANVKVRDLAARLVEDLRTVDFPRTAIQQIDHLLLTAEQRL